jgi:hypothetical protein
LPCLSPPSPPHSLRYRVPSGQPNFFQHCQLGFLLPPASSFAASGLCLSFLSCPDECGLLSPEATYLIFFSGRLSSFPCLARPFPLPPSSRPIPTCLPDYLPPTVSAALLYSSPFSRLPATRKAKAKRLPRFKQIPRPAYDQARLGSAFFTR